LKFLEEQDNSGQFS